jgi:hypothetical protein
MFNLVFLHTACLFRDNARDFYLSNRLIIKLISEDYILTIFEGI